MQKTAIVCVTNDLVTDQRVHKTCLTLQKCGYWVIVYGRLLPNSLPLNRDYFTLRKKLLFNRGPLFYTEFNLRLFFHLLFSNEDLVFANDLDTLPAAFFATKIRRKRLIFDAHELFSDVPELSNRPIIRKIWKQLEDMIIPRIKESLTVCQSIADFYNKKYGIKMKVVRNIPISKKNDPLKTLNFENKKIILYQGALNVGRGLEWVLNAMPFVDGAMLIIIGNGDIRDKLVEQTKILGIQEKVIFKGTVEAGQLHEYTKSADIGLCLLEKMGLNYYFALPNRVFDYIHAGVPILATRFPEITNIVETHKTGALIDHYEPEYLAKTINEMLTNPFETKHFEELSKLFCWENEEKVLMSIIQDQQTKNDNKK